MPLSEPGQLPVLCWSHASDPAVRPAPVRYRQRRAPDGSTDLDSDPRACGCLVGIRLSTRACHVPSCTHVELLRLWRLSLVPSRGLAAAPRPAQRRGVVRQCCNARRVGRGTSDGGGGSHRCGGEVDSRRPSLTRRHDRFDSLLLELGSRADGNTLAGARAAAIRFGPGLAAASSAKF